MHSHEDSINEGVSEITLASWQEFIPYVEQFRDNSYVYRGQADAKWKIVSTLDRHEQRFPTTQNTTGSVPEKFDCPPVTREVHLEAFKESVRGKRGDNPGELSENEWWALAQHHKLATPLLDWTYSPFVALFFAFEEEYCKDWQKCRIYEPENRVIFVVPFHMINNNNIGDDSTPELFSPRREITHRLSSQSGVLMKMPKKKDLETIVRNRYAEETSISNINARSILKKIVIPNKQRIECLKLLNKMNINRMSLFADLDGAAEYINGLWELDFETALGALPDGTPSKSTQK